MMIIINSIPYTLHEGVSVSDGAIGGPQSDILSSAAIKFIATLEREFGDRRRALLRKRQERQMELNTGKMPRFLLETEHIRSSYWKVSPPPASLVDRRVECVGPPETKTIVDALNSDANVFVADFEDSCSPTWDNILQGHSNLHDAVHGSLLYSEDGVPHAITGNSVKLMICPRGLHADEKHIMVDRKPVSASLFDFGMYIFLNGLELSTQGMGPYFYLPKIESHTEAKFWKDVFLMAQDELKLPHGVIKATVAIETIFAAFEMNEILFELKDFCIGLNCGWENYIFSFIKKFRHHYNFTFPDRSRLSTASHFLHSLSRLLIQTCHKRGVHAIAGISFEKPITADNIGNEAMMIKLRVEKESQAEEGFDGTTIIYPYALDISKAAFDGSPYHPNQLQRKRDDVEISADDLLTFHRSEISEQGMRSNINIVLEYLAAWLSGKGVVSRKDSIVNAASVEVARTQLWQWKHTYRLRQTGSQKEAESVYKKMVSEELKRLLSFEKQKESIPHYAVAKILLDLLVLDHNFNDFFTIPAYEHIV